MATALLGPFDVKHAVAHRSNTVLPGTATQQRCINEARPGQARQVKATKHLTLRILDLCRLCPPGTVPGKTEQAACIVGTLLSTCTAVGCDTTREAQYSGE